MPGHPNISSRVVGSLPIWRCPKMVVPPNHPSHECQLDHFSVETHGFGYTPFIFQCSGEPWRGIDFLFGDSNLQIFAIERCWKQRREIPSWVHCEILALRITSHPSQSKRIQKDPKQVVLTFGSPLCTPKKKVNPPPFPPLKKGNLSPPKKKGDSSPAEAGNVLRALWWSTSLRSALEALVVGRLDLNKLGNHVVTLLKLNN